jgi:hypothetical protein
MNSKNSKDLQSILKKRYEEGRLASLYILRYDSEHTNPLEWTTSFLSQITVVKNDHPDILSIRRNEEDRESDRDYKVEGTEWASLHSFIQYRPYTLKNKFVFIYDAHRISDTISNKLLKTFEDSPEQLTIFLFLKDQHILLPTILSRGITLQLHSIQKNITTNHFKTFNNPTKITEEIKSLDDGESLFISSVIDKILNSNPSYEKLSELLLTLESHEKYAIYNNALSSRIALILP